MCGCDPAFCLSPLTARRRAGIGGGVEIEKSWAVREIITWEGAAIEYSALTEQQADSCRRLSDAKFLRFRWRTSLDGTASTSLPGLICHDYSRYWRNHIYSLTGLEGLETQTVIKLGDVGRLKDLCVCVFMYGSWKYGSSMEMSLLKMKVIKWIKSPPAAKTN